MTAKERDGYQSLRKSLTLLSRHNCSKSDGVIPETLTSHESKPARRRIEVADT